MASERMRRRIDRLLDEADSAADRHEWDIVRRLSQDVLLIDESNEDAQEFVKLADRASSDPTDDDSSDQPSSVVSSTGRGSTATAQPYSFSDGRY
jgi:hypothetical protein